MSRCILTGGFDKEALLAGVGIVVYYDKGGESFRIRKNEVMEEIDNNNEAEYAALHIALKLLEEIGVRNSPCTIHGDSQVVIKQLQGGMAMFGRGLEPVARSYRNPDQKARVENQPDRTE
ncbi:reverse transcriptase-like protein [Rossellomorea sp. AcN35-11]|nr:reverse transcriptase-like protein [Rossellomorea sp. AcN35-11]